MSLVTVSRKRNRVYPRKFDHEQARARREAGESVTALAAEYGVTTTAVYRATDEEFRAREYVQSQAYQMSGTCVDCGGRCARAGERCRACKTVRLSTSVRDGELFCFSCKRWMPDGAFHRNAGGRAARRGRHGMCKSCSTAQRRVYREGRKVPCVGCGMPRLPKSENGNRGRDTGLCVGCYQASRRAA